MLSRGRCARVLLGAGHAASSSREVPVAPAGKPAGRAGRSPARAPAPLNRQAPRSAAAAQHSCGLALRAEPTLPHPWMVCRLVPCRPALTEEPSAHAAITVHQPAQPVCQPARPAQEAPCRSFPNRRALASPLGWSVQPLAGIPSSRCGWNGARAASGAARRSCLQGEPGSGCLVSAQAAQRGAPVAPPAASSCELRKCLFSIRAVVRWNGSAVLGVLS